MLAKFSQILINYCGYYFQYIFIESQYIEMSNYWNMIDVNERKKQLSTTIKWIDDWFPGYRSSDLICPLIFYLFLIQREMMEI